MPSAAPIARVLALALAASLMLALVTALAMAPTPAHAEPAFGDPNWVAPAHDDTSTAAADPTEPGPRVAEPEHEPTGVSILRLPFRVLFYPLRLVARGMEKAVSLPLLDDAIANRPGPVKKWVLGPVVTTDPGAGLKLTRRFDPRGDAATFITGTYAADDGRKAKFLFRTDRFDSPRAFQFEGTYTYRKNKAFYGIGNDSQRSDKTVWLGEESKALALFHVGKPVKREARITAAYSQISARSGTGGPPGVTTVENVFTAAEVPFLLRSSRVYSFGLAADLGLLDRADAPTRGVATRLSAEQFKAADTSDLDYRRFHTEARAYVPVFAPRRVLAFRVLHDWIDTAAGSPAVPYYRLPESNDDLEFNGYVSHRFMDNHLVLGQVEYRWEVLGRVDALVTATAGEVASTSSRLRFDQKHEAYGAGLRYGYNERWAGRVDVAKGSEGLHFNLTLEGPF